MRRSRRTNDKKKEDFYSLSHFTRFSLAFLLSAKSNSSFCQVFSSKPWNEVESFQRKSVWCDDSSALQILIAVCVGEWRNYRIGQLHKFHHIVVDVLRALIHDFVDRRFLVPRSRHDVLVVGWNVTAEHWRSFFRLKWRREKCWV